MFNAECDIHIYKYYYGHRNMFIAEPMRPKLSPRKAKMFNAEFMRCIWTYGHRNMFIAEPMRPKLSPRALGKNVQRWMWDAYGHMTETWTSLNLWDQNCHLATQKNSTLNGIVICIWQLQRHFARQNIGRNCTKSCLHRVQLREDYNMVQLLKGANDIINNNP